jgi:hypothetical protein
VARELDVFDMRLAPSASERDSFLDPPATPPAALRRAVCMALDPPLSDRMALRLVAFSIVSAFRFDSRLVAGGAAAGTGGVTVAVACCAGPDAPLSLAAFSLAKTPSLLLRPEPAVVAARGPAAAVARGL